MGSFGEIVSAGMPLPTARRGSRQKDASSSSRCSTGWNGSSRPEATGGGKEGSYFKGLGVINPGWRGLGYIIAGSEGSRIGYGFAAVRASLANMKRLHARSPVSRFATKTFFRLADLSPWLRKQAIDTGG